MENLILQVTHCISKINKKEVTEDSISTYLDNEEAHNIDNKSIIEILKRLQCTDLINQLYRSIDTILTSKASHSTPSQSIMSPIAENHANEASDNDIINKPTPSKIDHCLQLRWM